MSTQDTYKHLTCISPASNLTIPTLSSLHWYTPACTTRKFTHVGLQYYLSFIHHTKHLTTTTIRNQLLSIHFTRQSRLSIDLGLTLVYPPTWSSFTIINQVSFFPHNTKPSNSIQHLLSLSLVPSHPFPPYATFLHRRNRSTH